MARSDMLDPKGLIREAYCIDAIGEGECRSIFLDWALSLPQGQEVGDALEALVARHAPAAPNHPMTAVLRAGLVKAENPRRRGGWRGRKRD